MNKPTTTLPESITEGLRSRSDTIEDSLHEKIIRRVVACYQACKRDQPSVPAEYQPGGEWADYLAERQHVYDAMLAGDFATSSEKLRNFWRNELGPIVKEYAKYEQLIAADPTFVNRFSNNVKRNYDIWNDIYGGQPEVLDVPNVGNPWGMIIGGRMVIPKATRFHALSTQISELLRDADTPVVAEIGAGYGGQAYYLLRDNPEFTFVDFDLPETMILAAYYLLASLPDRKVTLYGEYDSTLNEAIRSSDAVLLPNFVLPQLADQSVDLFLNSFSFSEIPLPTLSEYISQVQRSLKTYLLHNNMDRTGVVNRGFERIPASKYPLDPTMLKCIYKRFDLFHGHEGDYREFLYQRIA